MIVGFTGTQKGMTDPQKKSFRKLLINIQPESFSQGCCTGADYDATKIAYELGIPCVAHPPINQSKVHYHVGYIKVHERKEYLDRNRDIANESELLIACPSSEQEELRSGTWSTIRYGRKSKRYIIIILPDGSTKTEDNGSSLFVIGRKNEDPLGI